MSALPAPILPPRKRTPGRPRIHPESASQKKKYIPGGPGGGGRWIETPTSEHSAMRNDTPTALAPDMPRQPSRSRSARATTLSRPRRERDGTRQRQRPAPRPRYSSAAAAAAATQASDGYKPREERGWEEFHPELDLEAALMVFTADEVDGVTKDDKPLPLARQATTNSSTNHSDPDATNSGAQPTAPNQEQAQVAAPVQTPKRKPGRPPRRTDAMLTGLGSPPAPRIQPMPTHNPKERLNLPKPSYRTVDTFAEYEHDRANQINYVDKSMANVGYQEGDRFDMPKYALIRHVEGPYDIDAESALRLQSDETTQETQAAAVGNVEYDMDEQDDRWLEAHNLHRKEEGVDPIKPSMFEIAMTQIEREYHALEKRIPKPNPRHPQTHRPRSSSAAAVNGEPTGSGDEPDTKCVICDDGDCENANAIIFCDGCDLAVHQECYGVPFIPEGQWFCRKCKEIGRGTPTCIFCPNVDGAFKQTNTLRWSHLLCAIWIPEVTIANTTFMEPIIDVEKVPKSRWGLNCYICNQKMGACIQCGNKACYQAFHVTCARRARLFLRMKSSHGGGIDASVLKAFCDRHVPPDWRREHDVDNAIIEAKRYYRHTMRNRRWADSQSAALAMIDAVPDQAAEVADEAGPNEDTIVVAGNKRRKIQPQKTGWRLPSGAPVVPAIVYNTVDFSLTRFAIRKRKEFLLEACKYWTLKREARKGAALLKRLQLQLETFSPVEITRRNFQAMGAAGRARLLRRIEFADILQKDVDGLLTLVQKVREREDLHLSDAQTLKAFMETIYFPLSPLLWPILQKAQKLDEKTELFKDGFDDLENKLSDRYYTSVAAFSADLTAVLAPVVNRLDGADGEAGIHDINDIHNQLNGVQPGTAQHLALSNEQKELKKVTKRIAKAVKEMIDVARMKESELKGIPFEKEMGDWAAFDARLEKSLTPKDQLADSSDLSAKHSGATSLSAVGGASASPHTRSSSSMDHVEINDDEMDIDLDDSKPTAKAPAESKAGVVNQPLSPPISTSSTLHNLNTASTVAIPASDDPWANGGTPWYLDAFDISGTTVHEERWTGKRAMSEALSEMDEETLLDLKEQSNGAAEADSSATAAASRPRRSLRGSIVAEPLIPEQTEEEIAAQVKKDKANAKRRLARRRNR